jgi:hypothetical protein
MKRILLIVILFAPMLSFSQKQGKDVDQVKYSRSSLHVMMIEDPMMEKGQIIRNTFTEMVFPNKYNNHLLKERYANIIGESNDMTKAGIPGFKLKGIEDKIANYFKEKRTANQLVAKWVNRDPESGLMNMDTIQYRGLWNADASDLEVGNMLNKATDYLKNSGTDLIKNTFVVMEYFEFIDNEKVVKPAAIALYESTKKEINKGDMPDMAKKIALKAAEKVLEAALEKAQGYTVFTHAYLYQLDWNDTIMMNFLKSCWMPENNTYSQEERQQRIQAFNNPDLFNLKLVGKSKASTIITNFKTERSQSDQIKEATIRSVDKVYIKLQKQFDVFKTKTQFYNFAKNGKVCTAKIGMKEGLNGDEKFDVLEQKFTTNGSTKWVKKGTIKVDKKAVWDNRYYITKPPELTNEDAIVATSFKGCKKGWDELILLLRQQK